MRQLDLSTIGTRQRPRVCVVGDIMLDRYVWGNADRLSPESPVPVVKVDYQEQRLGGAASVARLAAALEADVTIVGVVGDDPEAKDVLALLDDARIDRSMIVTAKRPTTLKTRFIGRAAQRHPHQILRVDREICTDIEGETESKICEHLAERSKAFDAVVVADYAKGVCSNGVIKTLKAARHGHLIVDPPHGLAFDKYNGVHLLKPNRAAASHAAGISISSAQDAESAAIAIGDRYNVETVLITLDKDGMLLWRHDEPPSLFSTHERNVYDITGAGDMVSAALATFLRDTGVADATHIANVAAGMEVDRFGVSPITRDELLQSLRETQRRSQNGNVISVCELDEFVKCCRRTGQRIVFTNGCFDLLHAGHLASLRHASQLGDVLIVAVNDDASVRRLKGMDRPVIAASERAGLVAALACVDRVVILDGDSPCGLIDRIRPDVLAKGGTTEIVVGREIVEGYGGRVVIGPAVPGTSTTSIAAKLSKRAIDP